MTLYELLKTVHVLSAATWFGSALAISVIGLRALRAGPGLFASFLPAANWWAGRAHPAAGVVLLVTAFAMVAEGDLSLGDPWLSIALAGLIVAMGVGGALTGRTSSALAERVEGADGALTPELRPQADRLLLYTRLELAIVAVVIVDMVVKPGL